MNRRAFLVRLGQAAAAVAATTVIDDPERLLWTPGKKTIIDLGATKQVLPVTDNELIDLETRILQSGKAISMLFDVPPARPEWARDALMPWQKVERDIRVDILARGDVKSFRFKGDKLVSSHSEADLRLLVKPFAPRR